MIYKQMLSNILNKPDSFVCLHTVKWFQVLLSTTNSFILLQINGFKYSYQTQIILFSINHLFAHS